MLASLGRFLVPCWRPLDVEGVPKSIVFWTNLKTNEKKEVQETGLRKHDCFIDFRYQNGRLEIVEKRFSHYTCCKLRDLGGQENWSKKGCRHSHPKWYQNRALGDQRSDSLAFARLSNILIFNEFSIGKKVLQSWQNFKKKYEIRNQRHLKSFVWPHLLVISADQLIWYNIKRNIHITIHRYILIHWYD